MNWTKFWAIAFVILAISALNLIYQTDIHNIELNQQIVQKEATIVNLETDLKMQENQWEVLRNDYIELEFKIKEIQTQRQLEVAKK